MKLDALCRDCGVLHDVSTVEDFESIEVGGCGKARQRSESEKCEKCGRTFLSIHFQDGGKVCSYCLQREEYF